MKRICLIWILIVGLVFICLGQQKVQVMTTVTGPREIAAQLDNLDQLIGRTLVRVTNLTSQPVTLVLEGTLTSPELQARTVRSSFNESHYITIPANATEIFTGDRIRNTFSVNNVEFFNIAENRIIPLSYFYSYADGSGRIPEGSYEFCFQAYEVNPNMGRPDFRQEINTTTGNCASILARVYDAPLIQSINDVSGITSSSSAIQVTENDDGSLRLQWQAPTGLDAGRMINYQILIAELLPGDSRDPNQVIQAIDIPAEPLAFYRENISMAGRMVTHVIMPVGLASPLLRDRTYAVQITASSNNPADPLPFQNHGRSPVYAFSFTGRSSTAAIQLASYPATGTYMPFRGMPVIVKYGPYSDTYNQFTSTFQMVNALGNNNFFNRELPWNPNPLEAQRRATGDFSLNQMRAQHIAISPSASDSSYPFYQYADRGTSYEWSSQIAIRDGRRVHSELIEGNFIAGMDRPILRYPANRSVQDTGMIRFDFKTAEEPVLQTLSPFDIVQSSRTSGRGSFDIRIFEKGVLELARNTSFDSVIFHKEISLNHVFLSSTVNNEAHSWQEVVNEVYREESAEYRLRDTGTYYWRVRWLNDPAADWHTASYNQSDTWQFVVKGDSTLRTDSVARSSNCTDPCEMNYEYAGGTPNAMDVVVGDRIFIGQFELEITQITGRSGSDNKSYTGNGVITNFGFIIDRVLVEFKQIKIANSTTGKRVYEGQVHATGGGNLASNLFHLLGSNSVGPEGLLSLGSSASALAVPFGWDQQIDGHKIIAMIDSITFKPNQARAKFRVGYDMPGEFSGHPVEFAAEVCIGPGGFKEDFDIYLDRDLAIGDAQDDQYTVILRGRNRIAAGGTASGLDEITKLSWNCEGFKSLKVAMEVQFARENILPENERTGMVDSTGRVSGFLNLMLERRTAESGEQWGFIGSINFPKSFQFTFLPGWGFKVQDAIFDFSESKNEAAMRFPSGYDQSLLGNGEEEVDDRLRNTWMGFYLKNIRVAIPRALTDKDSTEERTSFFVNNFLIDKTGLTGFVGGEHIASASDKGWKISLDTLQLGIVQTRSISGKLAGSLGAPFFEDDSRLNYSSMLAVGFSGKVEYNFQVNVPANKPLKMKMWQADMRLKSTSFLRFSLATHRNNAARFEGRFDGMIGLDSSKIDNVPGLSLSGIAFENFAFDTEDPNFFKFSRVNRTETGGQMVFSFASPQHTAGNFPLNIRDITISMDSDGAMILPKLGFVTELTLSDIGFKAALGMDVVGEMQLSPFNFRIRGVDVKRIEVACNFNGFKIAGGLGFYNNDPVYGKGLEGNISATLPMGIEGRLSARFGTVGEASNASSFYDYWYVDGMIKINPGITIFSGFAIYGFGGGAYYNMSMNVPPVPDAAQSTQSAPLSTAAGTPQPSGFSYRPNKDSFGVMATVLLGTQPNENVFNMDVTLHAQFNARTKGMEFLRFVGNGYVMSTMKDRSGEPPVRAKVEIGYYNTGGQEFVRGNFDVFLNVYDVIKGAGAGNKFLSAEIYADINGSNGGQWWFYMGKDRPLSARGGLLVDIPGLQLNANSYIMVGHGIPADLPPLPDDIRAILNESASAQLENQMTGSQVPRTRSGGTMQNGQGFAFGAHIHTALELNFLMFYTKLTMALGFDVNISKNLTRMCAQSGVVPGIDGWYAQGQAYAALMGEMGIKVDLFFIKGQFKFIDLKAVIAMQAKLPNPNYFQGRAALSYDIMQGMIKGRCNFNVELGEPCTPVSTDPLQGLTFISDMRTSENGTPTGVFEDVHTTFNFAMNEVLELEEESSGESVIRRFKPYVYQYVLRKADGTAIPQTSWRLMENGFLASMTHAEAFESATDYHAAIEVRCLELFANGSQRDSYRNGAVANETRAIDFTTGERPSTLMADNVLLTYPFQGQRNYLQQEVKHKNRNMWSDKGFMRIKQQDYLFATSSTGTSIPKFLTSYAVRFLPQAGGSPLESTLQYQAEQDLIVFTMPTLENQKTYHIQLIKQTKLNPAYPTVQSSLASNQLSSIRKIKIDSIRIAELDAEGNEQMGNYGAEVEISNRRVSTNQSTSEARDLLLFQYNFRTSRYNSFQEKMAAIQLQDATYRFGFKTLAAEMEETFDVYEAPSNSPNVSLISMEQGISNDGIMSSANEQANALNTFYRLYNSHRELQIKENPLPRLPIADATAYRRMVLNPNPFVTLSIQPTRTSYALTSIRTAKAELPKSTLTMSGNFLPKLPSIATHSVSSSSPTGMSSIIQANQTIVLPGIIPSIARSSIFTINDAFDWYASIQMTEMKRALQAYSQASVFVLNNITNSEHGVPIRIDALSDYKRNQLLQLGNTVYPQPQSGYRYRIHFSYQIPLPNGQWQKTGVITKEFSIK